MPGSAIVQAAERESNHAAGSPWMVARGLIFRNSRWCWVCSATPIRYEVAPRWGRQRRPVPPGASTLGTEGRRPPVVPVCIPQVQLIGHSLLTRTTRNENCLSWADRARHRKRVPRMLKGVLTRSQFSSSYTCDWLIALGCRSKVRHWRGCGNTLIAGWNQNRSVDSLRRCNAAPSQQLVSRVLESCDGTGGLRN